MVDTTIEDALLAPARLAELGGRAYSVGPYGIRVGFLYQQERALNIAYHASRSLQLRSDARILVAGGGLAGLMAKLTLHGCGFAYIDLYEQRSGILKEQRAASHRMVHPCFNNWPTAPYFSPTTDLPFLNWFSASASFVASTLENRWTDYYSRKVSKISCMHKVRHLRFEKGSNRVTATIEDLNNNRRQETSFDLVIAAMGFGPEKDTDTSVAAGYWTPDMLHSLREDETDKRTVWVSGIGDGGLMDFIRLGYRCPSEVERDFSLETICLLRHDDYRRPSTDRIERALVKSPVEREIAKVEREAMTRLPETATYKEFGTDAENDVAEFLFEKYGSIVDALPGEARDLLDSLVCELTVGRKPPEGGKRTPPRLKLIGSLKHPFTCATAPINKLLTAFLLRENPDLYVRARYEPDRNRIKFEDGSFQDVTAPVVVRHGGSPPIYQICNGFEKNVRALNRTLANMADFPDIDKEVCEHVPALSSADRTSRAYVDYRRRLSKEFSASFGTRVSIQKSTLDGNAAIWFDFDPDQVNCDAIARRWGGFPHEIFGLRLVASRSQVADIGLG